MTRFAQVPSTNILSHAFAISVNGRFKVNQFKEFFTEKYGSPREASDRSDILTWEDSVGQSYTLHIGLDADNTIPKSIRISFEP